MEVGVRVEGEKIKDRSEYHAISSYFTMVSVNEDGKPMEVPRLNIESEIEEKLFEAGKMRCAMRKEIQGQMIVTLLGCSCSSSATI